MAFWVYAATPLLALAACLDLALGGGRLREWLPDSPQALVVYPLLFGMPHIVASFFAYAEPALGRPQRRVLGGSLALAAAALVAALAAQMLLPFEWRLLDTFVLVATMVHVMGQQTGLALGQARVPPPLRWAAGTWRMLLAIVGCGAAALTGGEFAASPMVGEPVLWLQACGVLLLLGLVPAGLLARAAATAGGDPRGVLAMHTTLMTSLCLLAFGYPLLGIVLLRFVHDATAFTFYLRVAANRERAAPGGNPLYRRLGLRGRGVPRAVLPLAIGLSAAMAWVVPAPLMLLPILAHYVLEHGAWRKGSVLRGALGA
jgi:hypothetical protein